MVYFITRGRSSTKSIDVKFSSAGAIDKSKFDDDSTPATKGEYISQLRQSQERNSNDSHWCSTLEKEINNTKNA